MHEHEFDIDWFFDNVKEGWWTWSVELTFPRNASKNRDRLSRNPEKTFRKWIEEIVAECRQGCSRGDVRFLRAVKQHENGDVVFRVLLTALPVYHRRRWRQRWAELSAGTAHNKSVDGNQEQLFKDLFYESHWGIAWEDCSIIPWDPACDSISPAKKKAT
jgi:hypothetical protein